MSIEYIKLNESELMQLVLYKTITHQSDDVLHLSGFDALDGAGIDTCTVKADIDEYRVYYYTHKAFENAKNLVDIDASWVELPYHASWWCIEDCDQVYEESFEHLVDTDTVRLDGELINLVDFRLARDQWNELIYVYDTEECRYFFYHASWEDALENC